MPPIIAPSPRQPSQHSLDLLARHTSPSTPARLSHRARPFLPPPRLLSPIRLHDSSYSSKSPTPCGPSHKRRPASRHFTRAIRRRRHPQRVDCPFDAFGRPSLFDQLPWVSMLDVPSPTDCDLADLSQLPLVEDLVTSSDTIPASGPVRRRKASLRSNPLATGGYEFPPSEPLFRKQPPIHSSTDPIPDCPKTPPPCVPFDPSRVTFHNLMPVFPRGTKPGTPF